MSHRINHTPNDNFYGGMFCSYNTCCPSIAEVSLEEGQGGLGVAALPRNFNVRIWKNTERDNLLLLTPLDSNLYRDLCTVNYIPINASFNFSLETWCGWKVLSLYFCYWSSALQGYPWALIWVVFHSYSQYAYWSRISSFNRSHLTQKHWTQPPWQLLAQMTDLD